MDGLATARPGSGRQRRREVRPRALALDVPPLARQHPGLVHLAPALVGPPDSGVVRRGRQHLRRAQRGGRARAGCAARLTPAHAAPRRATCSTPGSPRRWCRSPRSAGPSKTPRPGPVPAVVGAGHRLRHHLLLGRADDHDDAALHRQGAVPRRLHQRDRARRGRPEDVEVEGQHPRSARPDRRHHARRCSRSPRSACCGRSTRTGSRRTAQAISRTAFPPSAPTRCASPSPRSRPSPARSTSTSTAARATATSATSCGTRRASC